MGFHENFFSRTRFVCGSALVFLRTRTGEESGTIGDGIESSPVEDFSSDRLLELVQITAQSAGELPAHSFSSFPEKQPVMIDKIAADFVAPESCATLATYLLTGRLPTVQASYIASAYESNHWLLTSGSRIEGDNLLNLLGELESCTYLTATSTADSTIAGNNLLRSEWSVTAHSVDDGYASFSVEGVEQHQLIDPEYDCVS